MYYLITEDSSGGPQFWKSVANVFKRPITCIGLSGISDLGTQLREFASNETPFTYLKKPTEVGPCEILGKEDKKQKGYFEVTCKLPYPHTVIVTYDILAKNYFSNKSFISLIENFAKKLPNTQVFYAQYASLEAVVLEFSKIKAWVHTPPICRDRIDQILVLNALNAFKERFRCHRDGEYIFFPNEKLDIVGTIDPRVQAFIEEHQRILNPKNKANLRLTTTERVCSAILQQMTKGTDFIFDKGTVGTGWTHDCQHLIDPALPGILEYQNHECQSEHLTAAQLAELGWSKSDIYDEELACRNMTAKRKLLTLFEESILDSSFINVRTGKQCSIKDVLGISHFHAAYEENSPTKPCSTCRLRESPAYKEAHQGAGQQSLLDVNQLPPPEPLPETTPQWNQQQPNNTTAWNPYQQPVEAWEQQPQYLNELPAPAGNPDNIDCIATSVFVQIEGYLFCTQKGTYGIWKEGKNNEKVISIVGLLDKQPITIGPAEKKLIKELRAEATLWEQKQIGSYGNGWQLNFPVSIAIGDKPKK